MKAWSFALFVVVLTSSGVLALPDQVATGSFFVNGPVESQVLAGDFWDRAPFLDGDWQKLEGADARQESLVISRPALAFGVRSKEMRLVREEDQLISFIVGFVPSSSLTAEKLRRLLRQNIIAYTGAKPSDLAKDRAHVFHHNGFQIEIREGFADTVELSFVPVTDEKPVATR